MSAMNSLPKFSIIIPVYNCERTIRQCLNALSSLDYPSYEIIIVDDGSTDRTAQICRSYQKITLISISNGGPSRARNIGVTNATGEILAFTDGDCIVQKNWLRELQKGFLSKEIAGVGGNQVSPDDESSFGQYIQATFSILGFATSYMKSPSHTMPTSHNPSCNSAYRKDIFLDVGGFDVSLWPGEDVDLDCRITKHKHSLIRCPKAVVGHYRPQSLAALGKMIQRYGGSAYKLFRRYGFFRPLQYLPFVTATTLVGILTGLILYPSITMLVFLSLPLLFFLFLLKEGLSKKTAILFLLSLYIITHWHLGFVKAVGTPGSNK
jgi:glycosyltransferase involved in cell wall biosynthesis